jgi:hypothetical protein
VGGEDVATFVPEPLPPREPPLEVGGKRAVLLTRSYGVLAMPQTPEEAEEDLRTLRDARTRG